MEELQNPPLGDALPSNEPSNEAILRTSAYHRHDIAEVTIWIPRRARAEGQSLLLSDFAQPETSLGALDRLPLETLYTICLDLDLATLFKLGQVNRRSRQIINSLHEYKIVTAHAISCVCAMLRTGSASGLTLTHLYQQLCQATCSICKENFGTLLHLLTLDRFCLTCLDADSLKASTLTMRQAKSIFKLSAAQLRSLRTLRTLPGIYNQWNKEYKKTHRVVALSDVLSIRNSADADIAAYRSMNSSPPRWLLRCMSCCALPYYDRRDGKIQHGISCGGCQLLVKTDGGDWNNRFRMMDKVYTEESFLEHYRECKGAQRLWIRSGYGKVLPLPGFCSIRGFLPRKS